MNTYYKRNARIPFQTIDDKTLLLNPDLGKVHELNATASVLWNQLNQPKNIDQLVECLQRQYTPSTDSEKEQINRDVQKIVSEWQSFHLIEEAQV